VWRSDSWKIVITRGWQAGQSDPDPRVVLVIIIIIMNNNNNMNIIIIIIIIIITMCLESSPLSLS
jgi:hypothetical protein